MTNERADLCSAFLTAAGRPPAPPPGLEEALRATVAEAEAAWPGLALALPGETFARHLGRVLGDHLDKGEDPARLFSGINAPDLYLACACLQRSDDALRAFEERCLAPLPGFLAGLPITPAFVDELRQVLRTRLFVGSGDEGPRLARYSGRGALLSWVRIVASRAALDLLQARGARPYQDIDDAPDHAVGVEGGAEVAYIKARYRDEFQDALRAAFGALSPEQRNLLRLHYMDGLTIDQLGALLRVHRATAARKLAAARGEILEATRSLLRQRLSISPEEFDSLCRVIQSQLDLSLSSALPP